MEYGGSARKTSLPDDPVVSGRKQHQLQGELAVRESKLKIMQLEQDIRMKDMKLQIVQLTSENKLSQLREELISWQE